MREGARGDGVEGGEERMVVCVDGRGEDMVVGSQGKSRHCCWWCQRERRKKRIKVKLRKKKKRERGGHGNRKKLCVAHTSPVESLSVGSPSPAAESKSCLCVRA